MLEMALPPWRGQLIWSGLFENPREWPISVATPTMAQVKRGAGESLIPLFSHPTLHLGMRAPNCPAMANQIRAFGCGKSTRRANHQKFVQPLDRGECR